MGNKDNNLYSKLILQWSNFLRAGFQKKIVSDLYRCHRCNLRLCNLIPNCIFPCRDPSSTGASRPAYTIAISPTDRPTSQAHKGWAAWLDFTLVSTYGRHWLKKKLIRSLSMLHNSKSKKYLSFILKGNDLTFYTVRNCFFEQNHAQSVGITLMSTCPAAGMP